MDDVEWVYVDPDAQAERGLPACLHLVLVSADERLGGERLEPVRDEEDAGAGSVDRRALAASARHADLRKAGGLSQAVSPERRPDAPSNPGHRRLSVTPRTADSSPAGSN
jgi:hypothetical protein